MILKFQAINYLNKNLEIDLLDPYDGEIAITKIDGLSPLDSEANMVNLVGKDGELFNSFKPRSGRTIKIQFEPIFGCDVEAVRHFLYGFFKSKRKVSLIFTSEHRIVNIDGYVTMHEPEIFEQRVTYSITIKCESTYFYGYNPSSKENTVTTKFTSFENQGAVEFPLSNEIPEDAQSDYIDNFGYQDVNGFISQQSNTTPLNWYSQQLFMGYLDLVNFDYTFDYDGDEYTTTRMIIDFKDGVPMVSGNTKDYIQIKNMKTGGYIEINLTTLCSGLGITLTTNHRIVINSEIGKKEIYIYDKTNPHPQSILPYVSGTNYWFELKPGQNKFSWTSYVHPEYLQLYCTYHVLYEGI